MAWTLLIGVSLVVWGLCGAVIAVGRRILTLQTTLYVHLVAAPVFAFTASTLHDKWFPGFDPLQRSAAMVGLIVALDALIVAPFFERSFKMFKSVIGTWLPFAAMFLAAWAA